MPGVWWRKGILELTVLGCSFQSELPAELTPRPHLLHFHESGENCVLRSMILCSISALLQSALQSASQSLAGVRPDHDLYIKQELVRQRDSQQWEI